jgi:Sensors of blue-light using FAD
MGEVRGRVTGMAVFQMIYASRPFGYDEFSLVGILASARANNQRDGITGCLICREDLFLQLLEGELKPVMTTYDKIVRDQRHTEVRLLCSGDVPARQFPEWAMRHDPARSWMWTAAAVASGAPAQASVIEVREIFARVARDAV